MCAEFAFCRFGYYGSPTGEAVEQGSQMFAMVFFIFRSYGEIVYIRVDEIETARDFVDESLTRLRGVPKSEHRVCRFEKSERCHNRGFFNIFGRYLNLMICANKVDFREGALRRADVVRSVPCVTACTCQVWSERSTHGSRHIVAGVRPSSVRRAGAMPTCFSMVASRPARSSFRTPP